MSKFNKDAGKFISLVRGAQLTEAYRVDQKIVKKHKEPILAAFFGINKLEKLLSKDGATGLRIYYGLDLDKDGKRDKKFVIVAVDADGNDILPSQTSMDKDSPADDILDTDILCPYDCPKANPLNSDTSNG
ncbi:hypothetical protein EGT74_14355 [Chitinophaga lutea]|uniref:Uncharacterized protein n=1 Tax=Chitinophaga lutea TaxID=2488634 RepID=A0A3N4PHR6_9BACT|nr:hypothetical protein [Chitinophaga lutea]RPE08242.1 hypothetical protein EGT74_14355 [Chitinophaga lutea]